MWLGERDHCLQPEVVVDGAERGSATYGDGFKGEHRASFSTLVSCFCGGTVLVGRCDARRKVVFLADFFDVERNPATIFSRCLSELWEQCLFLPECGEQWILWEASTFFVESTIFDSRAASGVAVVSRLVLLCCQCQGQLNCGGNNARSAAHESISNWSSPPTGRS